MTVGFNLHFGFGVGTTSTDLDPTKFDPILDENGKVIGYKPKKDKTEEVNHLKEENKGDSVHFTTAQAVKTEEQAKVDKTTKNVQNEVDKINKQLDFNAISKEDQETLAEIEQKVEKMENSTVTSYKAVLISQNILKSLDDIQQNANNTAAIEDDIKKDANEKDTTVTSINKDFGFLLTSAYKTFGAVEEEVEETDMDLVG